MPLASFLHAVRETCWRSRGLGADNSGDIADRAAVELIGLAPALAGFAVSDAARPGVRLYLANALRIAATMGEAGAENAAVFRPADFAR